MTQSSNNEIGNEEGSSLSPEIQRQQEDAIVERASAKGWKPQEHWKGDPEDWVPAKEFLGRQKLYDKISDLKGDLYRQRQKFDNDMLQISQYIAKMEGVEYQKAMKDLKAQRRAAMHDQDVERVEEIEAQIDTLEQNKPQPAPQPKASNEPTPEYIEWHKSNDWFQKDHEMTQDALQIGIGFANANPNVPQKQLLEHVGKKIRQMYPDRFNDGPPATKKGEPEVSDVEGGTGVRTRSARGGSKKLSAGDLSDDERKVMRMLVQRGALKAKAEKNKVSQEQQYLMDLAEAKGL